MLVMGVDPGAVSAAYALVRPDLALCDDVPVADKMVDGRSFALLVREAKPDVAVIERVSAMPKQGVSSSFRFGQGLGVLQGVLLAHSVKIIEVTPGVWKKFFKLGPDKEQARALAIKRFPTVNNLTHKKDAGRAEALLIAQWFLEQGL
jgi:Holliday junction resolvasome RuvABC endonuclease subunit